MKGTVHLSGSAAAVLQWQALCSCSVLKLPVEELLKLAIVHLQVQLCGKCHQRRYDPSTFIQICYMKSGSRICMWLMYSRPFSIIVNIRDLCWPYKSADNLYKPMVRWTVQPIHPSILNSLL